ARRRSLLDRASNPIRHRNCGCTSPVAAGPRAGKREAERQGDEESEKRLPFEYSVKRIAGIDYAKTQVDLPAEIADQIKAFGQAIPDDHLHTKGREAEPHFKIKYGLLANVAADDVRRVIENEPPVRLRFEKTEVFAADDFDVV